MIRSEWKLGVVQAATHCVVPGILYNPLEIETKKQNTKKHWSFTERSTGLFSPSLSYLSLLLPSGTSRSAYP